MNTPSYSEALEFAIDRSYEINLDMLRSRNLHLDSYNDYLVGTYPPLKAMGDLNAERLLNKVASSIDLYFHIPFCNQYCTFCHFAKEINPSSERVERYLAALNKEMSWSEAALAGKDIETAFFGGGTPSFLTNRQLKTLFDMTNQRFDLSKSEVSFELHPSLVKHADAADCISTLIRGGVNRFVLGVQSLDPTILRILNRGHGVEEVIQVVKLLNEMGIENLSLDLMYGLPQQTLRSWYDSIVGLLEMGIEKFNVFPLMFKSTDPVARHLARGRYQFAGAKERIIMHFMAEHILTKLGYRHGPIFYWTKRSQPHSVQQRRKYDSWNDNNLVPFGVGGFGYMSQCQFYNEADLDRYLSRVEAGEKPVWKGAVLSQDDLMRRTLMFALRSSGVLLSRFKREFGVSVEEYFGRELEILREAGLVCISKDGVMSLTAAGNINSGAVSLLFFSDNVLERVAYNDGRIADKRTDLLEKHDYSPAARYGTSAEMQAVFR
ncbi:coproporphyrinogen III oxidase family protein [Bradyrhizobium sp. WSM 1738]|uniref:coproporphyrinogen-III oxidase family protein n=1 Tax=Bradyrhizobium hereditatis TaxID=2821405 RepID=UPI001CE3A0D5|nr:coproporphyrinogen-III oxidase family protein [Bradyrhizobium hereditatis]MCA6116792.1 coproporphyrinogen III oxidase family protein [Bradyrhizobium hereditatis]